MRVSIVNLNLVGPDATGQAILNQIRFFQRRGDEVQVYILHPPADIPRDVLSLINVVSLDDLIQQRSAHFACSDLYIYHYTGRYALMESIRELNRGAVIFYYHNVTPPELWGSDFDRDLLYDSVKSVGRYTPYADLVVTDSAFNADQLVTVYDIDPDTIHVLPLAVSLEKFQPGEKDKELIERYRLYDRSVILFVGRMAGNKRVDLLVEALPLIRAHVSNAILLLVGDDHSNPALQENAAYVRRRAKDLGVADFVVFTGRVDELAAFYRLADVYVTASLHEGFGVPLIEAMASGVPIVATEVTTHPWVLGGAGVLVEPEDVEGLAKGLVRVLTDDVLYGKLVSRGLERAVDFSLENYYIGWSRIVREATANLPRHPYPRIPILNEDGLGFEHRGVRGGEDPERNFQHILMQELEGESDIMLRNYRVRSGIPFLGSFIVWARRHLTSHLREPYLDPTLERQVSFNRRVVQILDTLLRRIDSHEVDARRIATLEAQVADLTQRLNKLQDR